MRSTFLALVWCWVALPIWAAEKVIDFGQYRLDQELKGFRSTVTGEGRPGAWKIVLGEVDLAMAPVSPKSSVSNKRPVLAQVAQDPTDEHFPLLVYEEETFGDFMLTTHFRLVSGMAEQMAGIAFRLQDERNYYYFRASALGDTFYFFKVVAGVRSAPIGAKWDFTTNTWHELVIQCKGDQIRAWLDGKEPIPPLTDKSFATGKVAFWTKSDAVSQFRDLVLAYTPRTSLAQVLVRETMEKYPRLKGLQICAPDPQSAELKIMASSEPTELGRPAQPEMQNVIGHQRIHYGKGKNTAIVALPIHDRNGETIAALKVVMKSFPGQTEQNAVARALPILKQIQPRVQSLKDLLE